MRTTIVTNPVIKNSGGAFLSVDASVKISLKSGVADRGNEALNQLNEKIGNHSQTDTLNRTGNAIHHTYDGHQNNFAGNVNQSHSSKTNNSPQNPPTVFDTRTSDANSAHETLRNAVVEFLRQNDVFLSRSVVNDLLGNQNSGGNNETQNIPSEIRRLVQTFTSQFSDTLNNSNANHQIISQTAPEIYGGLQTQIDSVRRILFSAPQTDAKHFTALNISERLFLAVELIFRHLPPEMNLNQLSNREIYDGLMLARGLISSNEKSGDLRTFISFGGDLLPENFSFSGLRNLGQLVKILIADAANAKTTVNLDSCVQKFVKILISNNELGILLAAAAIAKQTEPGAVGPNRTLALVQIYSLISRLIQTGEAAIKENAAKNGLPKNENNFAAVLNKSNDAKEKTALFRDLQNNNFHTNLKNFLDFNPAFVAECAVSSFINPDDERHAQKHFSAHHTAEIRQWLDGGDHRFVKEIELDKPLGIVVERGAEEFFTVSKARIVLVRDSSEQGWHFLKTFLVK